MEKLTDKNLDLEEKIEQLNETVADLEALRDLSEEQEELRMEVEHDLREELDMSLNSVRQVRSLPLSPLLCPSLHPSLLFSPLPPSSLLPLSPISPLSLSSSSTPSPLPSLYVIMLREIVF